MILKAHFSRILEYCDNTHHMSFRIPISAYSLIPQVTDSFFFFNLFFIRSEILKTILRDTSGVLEVLNLYVILCILSSFLWREWGLWLKKRLWIAAIFGKINSSPVHQINSGRRIIVLVGLLFHVESFSYLWNRLLCITFNISLYLLRVSSVGLRGFCLGNSSCFLFYLNVVMAGWTRRSSQKHGLLFLKSFTLAKVTFGQNFREGREGVMMKCRGKIHPVFA